jgi:hypothetical protein
MATGESEAMKDKSLVGVKYSTNYHYSSNHIPSLRIYFDASIVHSPLMYSTIGHLILINLIKCNVKM